MTVALLLTCGLPGAGKSTFCTTLVSHVADQFNCFHIEFDHVFLDQPSRGDWSVANAEQWKQTRTTAFETVRELLQVLVGEDDTARFTEWKTRCASHWVRAADHISHKDTIVVVDDNMYYKSMRKQYHSLALDVGAGFGVVWLAADFTSCCLNNAKREMPIPQQVLERMNTLFEPPMVEDKVAELPNDSSVVLKLGAPPQLPVVASSLALPEDVDAFRAIDAVLEWLLDNPLDRHLQRKREREIVEQQKITKTNYTHQLDLKVRKAVDLLIKEKHASPNDGCPFQEFVKNLSQRKKRALQLARTHGPPLPGESLEDNLEHALTQFMDDVQQAGE